MRGTSSARVSYWRASRRLPLAAALSSTVVLAAAASGQQPAGDGPRDLVPPAPLVTLALWADDTWLAVSDRDGSYHGRLAREGIFQRFHPLMDDEYDLDVVTGLFTASEDARWSGSDRGLRLAGASISHPHILNDIDMRQPVQIDGPVDLLFRYRRQRSLTAQRDYPQLGLRWRGVAGSAWDARVRMGIHFFKPSADLELGVGRRWQMSPGASIEADLRLALLDLFNNAIFRGLGVEPDLVDAHLEYTTVPLGARLALTWRMPGARIELQGGATNRSRLAVTFPATGDTPYTQAERVAFVGGLAEAVVSSRVAIAVFGTWARADTERSSSDAGGDHFALTETTWSVGSRVGVALSRTLAVEADAGGLWRPEDRSSPGASPFRLRDRTAFAQVALVRRPPVGWLWRVALPLADRDAGETLPGLTATNTRLVMEGGRRWASSFYVVAGVRWDIDSFGASPFDGGHVRIQATW